MRSDPTPGYPYLIYKVSSFAARLPIWMKARLGDVMAVAEAMHRVQWAAPWDNDQPESNDENNRWRSRDS